MNQIKLQERPELFFEAAPQEELDLLARHDLYFETLPANTPALINTAHALRYQVYCLERQFEKTEEHADGMEADAFDSHSVHGLLFYRLTGEALGTLRIISPNNGSTQDNLPIIQVLRDNKIDLADYLPIERTVEISRFSISKQLRRRLIDQGKSSGIAAPRSRLERERHGNLPFLSLLQFILRHTLGRRDGDQIASNVGKHGHLLPVNWAGCFAPWYKAALLPQHF
jgi:N-acyl amino acid synthase of PEP-CTERM/exosortase system